MTAPGTRVPGVLPPEVQERNREIVAERLGWPAEALGNCRQIEARFPAWRCWWTTSPYPDPGFSPAYAAAPLSRRPLGDPGLYARTPGELAELIGAEDARREPGWPGA